MRVNADLPVAVVTGGNRGVGREVCRQLALLGFGVVLGSRDLRKGEIAAKELDPEGTRIVACQLEVDNSLSVAAMADWVKERFGRTDVLVNNASTMYDQWATASNADLGTVAEAIDVNLFGPWRVIHALLPMLRSSARPRIVNVSSEGGSIAAMTGGSPAYGISTGFGALATRHISPDLRAKLQLSLIRSHAAGAGQPVEREVVRALMFLRLKTLASGRTGIRPVVAETLAAVLNAGITPVVPEHGSLGCSGDLAPLAHCALVLTGEGEADTRSGERVPGGVALDRAGITPVRLEAKEGLALINGTDGMLGMLVLAATDLRSLLKTADVTAAMSVEALLGTDSPFAADLQALRPHPGQAASAANFRALLNASPMVASHKGPDDTRVQDAYSLRCSPQVHGAARDTLDHAETVAGRVPVLLDSGVRTGADVFLALALGASAVVIGRLAAYGLAAAGEHGVKRTIELLTSELKTLMILAGVPDIPALTAGTAVALAR